ncbi:valine--pyruvate transaminase [Cerasicoccus fimbriatus]|uniref:valine--pyruvate transaminase n=1 Tax=Cerasicoccus fimbriatus TaxID=3014554 RepID=UPI0022B54D9D|nr:valine--pyruvate transaminase [Cerasicoccus sp. TK19100]
MNQRKRKQTRLQAKLAKGSGIERLMDDLGRALAEGAGHVHMLGGGNPAPIPEVAQRWRTLMREMLDSAPERFDRMLGVYDPQQGNGRFIRAVAKLFNDAYGWGLTEDNIVITNGGQTAYFYLFNLLAGEGEEGLQRILFPLMPEYIGYAEQGLHPESFIAAQSIIEELPGNLFKYRVDFDNLPWDESIAAVCVSRPTNPTGNVLTDAEVQRLHQLCTERGAYLIIDNAYGAPFPDMIFTDVQPFWGENTVLTYSLSKLGLPGTRTGILIGPPEICRAISSMNAVAGLANGNVGQSLTLPLFESGEIMTVAHDEIRPYYQERSQRAVQMVHEAMDGVPCRVHVSEGALFLWLWFPGLPGGADALYEDLKEAGVLVVPGHFFFHALPEPWPHAEECIRINYAMNIDAFPEAMRIMAVVVRARFERD